MKASALDPFPYDKSVFLNGPFDVEYKPILDAMLFCIHDCGYIANIALQDIGSQVRINKIINLIRISRYSIHDLSRVEEPRLNMAFECGICFGAQEFGDAEQKKKDMLILDAESHRFKRTMSDIGGHDAMIHHNQPAEAIHNVRNFLARKARAAHFMGGSAIASRYECFGNDLPYMANAAGMTCKELTSFDYLPELIGFMVSWIKFDDGKAGGKRPQRSQ